MPFIRTNLQAGLIARQLEQVNRGFTQNLERLSTGLRLNRPDDNPGFYGMNLAHSLQIRSADQGVINAQNAAGMMQTAEEGIVQIVDLLNRAHELAIVAADSTVDSSARQQANTELKALITGPDDGADSELKQILDSVKYNNITLLAESNSAASITTNTLENSSLDSAVYTDGAGAQKTELSGTNSTFADTDIGTNGTVNAATLTIAAADADELTNIDVGDALYIEAYDESTETTYTSQVLVVRETTPDQEFVVVRLDGALDEDVDEITNINTVMGTIGTDNDYVKIYEIPTTQLGDTVGAKVLTDTEFDFSTSSEAQDVYTELRAGVQLNSTQSGTTATDPTLSAVNLTLSDTNPLELAASIQSQIETQLGGQYKAGGNKHITVEAVAQTYVIVDTSGDTTVDFNEAAGATIKSLGWQALTTSVLNDSRSLLSDADYDTDNVTGVGETSIVADLGDDGGTGNVAGDALSKNGIKFRFTTTKTMNQDYTPRIGVNDDALEGYSTSTYPQLFSALKTDNGLKGNDQFDIEFDGVEYRADLEVAGPDVRATDSTSDNEAAKSIDTVLYEVWHKTGGTAAVAANTYGLTTTANAISSRTRDETTTKATYAGVNLKTVVQEGVNDPKPSILGDKIMNVSYPVSSGKLTLTSSTMGQSSTVAIGSELWDSTAYSGLSDVATALGLVVDRSDAGTGSDFTFRLGGDSDQYSIMFDTFGSTGMGEDNVDVSNLDISTQQGAAQAINTLEDAINSVSSSQTKIGAGINHMSRRMYVLETHSEALAGQKARFEEIDFTEETRQLASLQILLQSGTAALAQANIIPQTLLQLLA